MTSAMDFSRSITKGSNNPWKPCFIKRAWVDGNGMQSVYGFHWKYPGQYKEIRWCYAERQKRTWHCGWGCDPGCSTTETAIFYRNIRPADWRPWFLFWDRRWKNNKYEYRWAGSK